MAFLTVVFKIHDSESFKDFSEEFLQLAEGQVGGEGYEVTAMSTSDEILRLEKIENVLRDDELSRLEKLWDIEDIVNG